MTKSALKNTTWDELQVGQSAQIERQVTANDLVVFAHASGNTNPIHIPNADHNHDGKDDAVAPSLWVGSLVSSVLGVVLPGTGTLYREQSFKFLGRAYLGDRLIISVKCIEKKQKPIALFQTKVTTVAGRLILEGIAEVEAPATKVITQHKDLPLLLVDENDHFGELITRCRQLPPMPTAVVCPDDKNSLGGALLSRDEGLIIPILIGDAAKIRQAAETLSADLTGVTIIDIADHGAAAEHAVAMANAKDVRAVMKGNIHSDELLSQIVKKDGGLRTSRRISHVFAMDVPTQKTILFISDAAINIAPDLPPRSTLHKTPLILRGPAASTNQKSAFSPRLKQLTLTCRPH